MQTIEEIDEFDIPDVMYVENQHGGFDIIPDVTQGNIRFLIRKYNELVRVVSELVEKQDKD